MKYWTIDLEGDGLNREYNKQIFPDGNHFDPETRIWCCTFCGNKEDGTIGKSTFVCKLPPVPRRLLKPYKKGGYDVWVTSAIHEVNTVIPEDMVEDDFEADMYKEFITRIYRRLRTACDKGITVYFKGYGTYEYDKDLLRINFMKYNLPTDVLDCMKLYTPDKWESTELQIVHARIPNQEYMNVGIKHNIEDAVQLLKVINSSTTI